MNSICIKASVLSSFSNTYLDGSVAKDYVHYFLERNYPCKTFTHMPSLNKVYMLFGTNLPNRPSKLSAFVFTEN